MFHLGPPHFQFYLRLWWGNLEWVTLGPGGALLRSLMVRAGGAMVPQAPRMVQKPVVQAAPQVVQKEGGGGESRDRVLPEGRERVPSRFSELISSNRSRGHVLAINPGNE